LILIRRV